MESSLQPSTPAPSSTHTFPLTALRMRLTCMPETPVHLEGFKAGSLLRGALLSVMLRTTCALTGIPYERRAEVDPAHVATCPVCWLIQANEQPGNERRGYLITPPLPVADTYLPGQPFTFHLTLFGNATTYIPYFIISSHEMGRTGVGKGRGRFTLHAIHAELSPPGTTSHPEEYRMRAPDDTTIRIPPTYLTHEHVLRAAADLLSHMKRPHLTLHFLTPLRLVWENRLVKTPEFLPFFRRLLERVDMLASRHADAPPRPPEDRTRLYDLATRVRLQHHTTHWEDVKTWSSRIRRYTWISGLVGSATYTAPREVWEPLLPWLLWGTIVQVGKDAVKGNGVFRVSLP